MAPGGAGGWVAAHSGAFGRAFSNASYRTYQSGNFLSLIGTWVNRIAVGWLAWELTHSGAWLGAIAAAELAPSILMGPIGGVVADRVDRLTVVRVTQSLMCLVAIAMAAGAFMGVMTPWLLFGLNLMAGLFVSFGQPARLSIVRALVRPADLPAAVATNSVLWNGARFIGPAVAGALIASFGVGWAFAFNAASYVIFMVALLRLKLGPTLTATAGRRQAGMFGDLAEGVRYVSRHPGIGPLLLLLVANAITVRPYVELLPGFADAVFGRGVDGLAALTAAVGIGAIVAGVLVGDRDGVKGLSRLAVDAVLVLAGAAIIFAATENFWIGLVGAALSGAAMVVSGVAMQTLIQNAADPSLLSRVLSLYGLWMRAGPAAGALIMGAASEYVGLRAPVIVGAMLCAAAWLWARVRLGRIRASLEE